MKILNTMSGQKEEFVPLGETVKMYVCGVTPYDNSHFGHAMSYVFFDVIRRYILFKGYKLKYVQNVTDIEDKIILRANQRGISTTELAEKFTASYFEDMAALNVMRPDVTPRATQEVPKIIEVIAGLIDKGYAYKTPDGSVYFRVTKDQDYGQLSHRTLDMMQAGARIEIGESKENPMDFALWKASKPAEPAWDSPWGKGRPGWHIECTAMSLKYLGEQIDIHAGGMDLIFPHHENEIAQSESFTGKKPFVKYWLHNGFLQIGEEKMSKSLGNMLTIKEVLAKYNPDAVRAFILSSHYRSPLSFTTAPALDAAQYRQQFIEAMDDDFNSAKAMGILFDLARDINQAADSGSNIEEAAKSLKDLAGNVLGLKLKAVDNSTSSVEAAPFIELLIQTRLNLRAAKQFQLADEIRQKLTDLGILLEDGPKGTTWRKKG
jgi:cysteinyl-tRNA synthetase